MEFQDTAARFANLATLLYVGCELAVWCFDKDGKLYHTTSAYGKELGTFLEIGGCKEYAMTKGIAHDKPFVMSDALGMIWVGEYVEMTENTGRILVLMGPMFHTETTQQTVRERMREQDVSLSLRNRGQQILSHVPVLPIPVMNQYIRMFHFSATGQIIGADEYVYQSDLEADTFNEDGRLVFKEKNPLDYENSYAREQLILQCVREGNLAYENIVGGNYLQRAPENYMTGDSLREAKDILIIFTSQCCRAAIEGKLSVKTAKEMERQFVHEIEKCWKVTQLVGLRRQIMDEYISRVHELDLASGLSRPICLCRDYVNAHFMKPIKLSDIAREAGYTEYYLTRKFQKEMGQSLGDYIRKTRLIYAKILLVSSEKSIQEISEWCQFGSRNYFTRLFKAEEGISPQKYRENYFTGTEQ